MELSAVETQDVQIDTTSPKAFLEDVVTRAKDNESQDQLYGNCTFNARRVYDILTFFECEPTLVRGAFNATDEITSIQKYEEQGLIHWWVEVTINNTDWIIDLASESETAPKQTIISTQQPRDYMVLERDPMLPGRNKRLQSMLYR